MAENNGHTEENPMEEITDDTTTTGNGHSSDLPLEPPYDKPLPPKGINRVERLAISLREGHRAQLTGMAPGRTWLPYADLEPSEQAEYIAMAVHVLRNHDEIIETKPAWMDVHCGGLTLEGENTGASLKRATLGDYNLLSGDVRTIAITLDGTTDFWQVQLGLTLLA